MGMANFENRTLFKGDNLPFLQGLNSESVDLIATDPPFNKGKDFHATPDSLAAGAKFHDRWTWERDTHEDWIDAIADYGDKSVHQFIRMLRETGKEDMAAFLCFLGVRLMECQRILKPTGSLYLHIDHTAHAYAKVLMDGIFGRDNFRNEIVWAYTGPANTKRWFPRKHDSILWYSKGNDWIFNREAIRVPYSQDYIERFKKQYNEGADKSSIFSAGHNTERNQELAKVGKVPEDWWPEFSPVGRSKTENTGYPTQKPLKLYERIIAASSNPGDFVLDPFCGCATTPVAAERLGRRWIGMDLWDGCHQIIIDRLNQGQQIWQPGHIRLVTNPLELERTDDAERAAPHLPSIERRRSRRPQFSRQEMFNILLEEWGIICWGCGFEPPNEDRRHFELDHNNPKGGGGSDELDNRAILCGPCNRAKSNILTLEGLRRQNKQGKHWYKDVDSLIPLRLAAEWAREYWGRGGKADD